jgi:hypothetical protein
MLFYFGYFIIVLVTSLTGVFVLLRNLVLITYYMDGIYDEIEQVVKRLQRNLRRGVLPKHVQPHLPYDRAEGSIRRDMGEMWEAGRLVRAGGQGTRRGYRCPSEDEAKSFRHILDGLMFMGRASADDVALRMGLDGELAALVLEWLAEIGRVIRVHGGGYRMPSKIETLAWQKYGLWPYGAERAIA